MSELLLYFEVEILSYFKSFNWSLVSSGFGNISKSLAENSANGNGKGIYTLFLPINFNNFSNKPLNEIISGPTHSIIFE